MLEKENSALNGPARERVCAQTGFAIEAEGLVRRFGQVEALSHVSLAIRPGEFFSLLGPSGCGKTTLLRIIAGLDLPNSGTLRISGRLAAEIPAHQRPVNTVFQSYALFPHMTVWDNVSFGLRMKKVPHDQVRQRVRKMLELVEITDLADRRPDQLSGGQKQRVALARAVVNEPEVLLLDEPLGALDLKLRKQLQLELHQLQRRLGITFIYVTHDQDEALVMSDRIAVMNAGRVEQVDAAQELYEQPRTRFVAQFLGSSNLLAGTLQSLSATGALVVTPVGLLKLGNPGRLASRQAGQPLTLAIRPEKVILFPPETTPGPNQVKAQVESLVYSGAETQYLLRSGETPLRAVALNAVAGQQSFRAGDAVVCTLPGSALVALED